jgi:hypothetical protein
MSDVAEAPTPVVEATEAPIEVTEAPVLPDTRTAEERMAAIKERGRGVRPEPTLAEAVNERARDEQGRFVAETPEEVATEETVEQPVVEPVAEPEVPAEGAEEPTVKTLPEGFVEIPLPEDHPLRARGLESLPFPADQEEYGRSIVNQALSKKEVEGYRASAEEAQRRALTAEAETKFWRENTGNVFSPEFQAKYEDIKQTYGEEDAEDYRNAQIAKAQDKVGELRDQALAEARDARQREHGQAFSQLAIRDALHGIEGQPRYPGWQIEGSHGIHEALGYYGNELNAQERESGREHLPNAQRWHEIATMFYQSHPAGRQVLEARDAELREALRKEVEGEATKREKEALEAARTNQATNPLAGVPPVETGQTTTSGDKKLTAPEQIERIRHRAKFGKA